MDAKQLNSDEIVEVGEGFLDCSLPPERFDHRGHLIATAYILVTYPDRDWDKELPECIRAFNLNAGGTNDDTSGYHHTITAAFLAIIRAMRHRVGQCDAVTLCTAVLASPAGERDFLLRFWSRQTLFSTEARIGWIPPDLHPAEWVTDIADVSLQRTWPRIAVLSAGTGENGM